MPLTSAIKNKTIDYYVIAVVQFQQQILPTGLPRTPVRRAELLVAPAERADVIVDFSAVADRTIRLVNVGPDEPFGGGTPGVDFEPADPDTTGQVMQFRVTLPLTGSDTTTPPGELTLPTPPKPGPKTTSRDVSLNESPSTFPGFEGPVAALLGTMNGAPTFF